MAKLLIEAIRPRRVAIGQSNGKTIYRDFTADDCRRYAELGNQMLSSRIAVPVCWNHRDDAKPTQLSSDDAKSELARGTAGYVERYVQVADGRVMAEAEIPDDQDANRAKIVRFASPEIERFIDGNGRDWGEVITHLALTPRPRQHDQEPIRQLGFTTKKPIRLAIDPQEGSDMADEAKDTDTSATDSEGGQNNYFQEAIEHLANKGINLPEDTTPENVWERIVVACMQGDDYNDNDMDNNATTEGTDNSNNLEEVQPTNPVMMGFQKQKEIALGMAVKNIKQEITDLLRSGQITTAIQKSMTSRLDKIKTRLSFDKDGNLQKNELLIEIEAYKKLPKGAAWSKAGQGRADRGSVRMSHGEDIVEAGEPPLSDGGDEPTKERLDEFGDKWDAIVGRPKAKK